MITKKEKIRLGFFIATGLIVLMFFLLITAGKNLFKKRDYYYIEYKNSVSGLSEGSPVKRRGVEIGQVKNISFSESDVSKIIVKIAVKEDIKIKADAKAIVEVFGITGIKYIDIVGETNSAPLLEKGAKIKAGISTIDMVTGKADIIAQKIELALNNLIAITEKQNQTKVVEAIEHTNELTKNINNLVLENKDNIKTITTELSSKGKDAAKKINLIFSHIDSSLNAINKLLSNKSLLAGIKNFEEISTEIKTGVNKGQFGEIVTNLNNTLKTTNQAVSQFNKTVVQNKDKLNQIMDRLNTTTRNLSDFTHAIKENPSLLIRKQE